MKRRNCVVVITEMLSKIPSSKSDFIEALKWNLNDASYKPPEETLQWERTQRTLQNFIRDPEEDWEFEVLSIFTTRPIEELRKAIQDEGGE